jgi:hypothetical protein
MGKILLLISASSTARLEAFLLSLSNARTYGKMDIPVFTETVASSKR